jgi:hypothetical protein
MYYKILVHCGRTCNVHRWRVYPDTNSALNWRDITDYLEKTRVTKSKPYLLRLFEENNKNFDIVELAPQDSKEEPLVQLADIFVGMGCFSLQKREKLQKWLQRQQHHNQQSLLPIDDEINGEESRAEGARFELIHIFYKECKTKKLRVSLETKGYLWTPNQRNPINFWLYQPQHDTDKAPTKQKSL